MPESLLTAYAEASSGITLPRGYLSRYISHLMQVGLDKYKADMASIRESQEEFRRYVKDPEQEKTDADNPSGE